jgi:hypothetical protein
MQEKRKTYKDSVGISEGKRPSGKYGCRWEDNIKVDHKEIVCEDVD